MFSRIYEYPETTVLFLIVAALLFYVWRKKSDFFSPAPVYIFFQCLTLAIAYLKLDHAMTPFHAKTWFVWLGAMLSFVSGCLLFEWTSISKGKRFSRELSAEPLVYHWKLHFVLSCIVLLIYLVGIFGIVKTAGTLILFSGNAGYWASRNVDYGIYAQFFSSAPLVVLLFGVSAFKSLNPVRWIRWISLAMLPTISILAVCAYPSRTTLFMCVGFAVIMFHFLCKRISVVLIAVLLALGIAGFVFVASARSQYGGNSSVEAMTLDAAMTMPYKYVANNYWNLDYALNSPPDREIHPFTYGIDFFSGMLEYARVGGALKRSFGWDGIYNESVQKIPGYNTTGYLWEIYKDFGLPGCFLVPFLVGLGMSVLYARMIRKKTPCRVMFYVYFIYFVGFWFFLAGYKQGIFWAWGVIVWVVSTVCALPPKGLSEIPEEKRAQNEVSA